MVLCSKCPISTKRCDNWQTVGADSIGGHHRSKPIGFQEFRARKYKMDPTDPYAVATWICAHTAEDHTSTIPGMAVHLEPAHGRTRRAAHMSWEEKGKYENIVRMMRGHSMLTTVKETGVPESPT